jgi:hypothetical protein
MKAIPCPVTPEELRRLVHEEKFPDHEIATRFPGGTKKRVPIKRIARELGVGGTTVSRRMKEWGVDHPRKTGRPRT